MSVNGINIVLVSREPSRTKTWRESLKIYSTLSLLFKITQSNNILTTKCPKLQKLRFR